VTRKDDTKDRRAKRVFLTDEVEPAMKAMRHAAADMRKEALVGISESDQDRFIDILLRLKTNLIGLENPNECSRSNRQRGLT